MRDRVEKLHRLGIFNEGEAQAEEDGDDLALAKLTTKHTKSDDPAVPGSSFGGNACSLRSLEFRRNMDSTIVCLSCALA